MTCLGSTVLLSTSLFLRPTRRLVSTAHAGGVGLKCLEMPCWTPDMIAVAPATLAPDATSFPPRRCNYDP